MVARELKTQKMGKYAHQSGHGPQYKFNPYAGQNNHSHGERGYTQEKYMEQNERTFCGDYVAGEMGDIDIQTPLKNDNLVAFEKGIRMERCHGKPTMGDD